MGVPLCVLIVEDSEIDALFLMQELRRGGYDPVCERVETSEALSAALDRGAWDAILIDYTLPYFSGIAALEMIKRKQIDLPAIIVSGTIDDETAVAAMKAGAHDYIMKNNLPRLIPALEREMRETKERQKRRRIEKTLQETEKKFFTVFQDSPVPMAISSITEGRFFDVNEQYIRLMEFPQEELIGHTAAELNLWADPEERKRYIQSIQQNHGKIQNYPVSARTKSGNVIKVLFSADIIKINNAPYLLSSAIDITDRLKAEAALRRVEENFRRSLDDSPLGVRIVTIEGETVYANRAVLNIFGYDSIEELKTTPLKERYTPESYAEFQIRKEKRKRGDYSPSEYEVSIVKKDGEVRHLQVFRKEIFWDGERQFQVIYQDITERKRARAALRESEERYRALFTRAADGIFMMSTDGNLVEVNESFARMHGYNTQEMLNMNLKDLDTPETFQLAPERMRRILAGEALTFEVEQYHKDGHVFPLEVSASRISSGGRSYIQCFHRDITKRKRAEEEVHDSREQMRALARHLQAVREEERTLIAREIHDELGGALTGLKIDVSLLTRAMLKIENETVRTSLLAGMDSMIKFTDATIQTVRRIAMELRPGILDDLGLVAALEWQLIDFEKRTGIRCEFFPPGEDINLDADLSTALFRIFQEALTNVARHSGATEVRVRLRMDADSSALEVEDNGKGIEKEKILSSKSLGLLGMRERAQMFKGRIIVTGTPGRGTKVTVEISPAEKGKMDRDQGGAAG